MFSFSGDFDRMAGFDKQRGGGTRSSLRARQIATIQNKIANSGALDRSIVIGPLFAQLSGEAKLRQADIG
jgi:hypothetical protein